jgi:tRNA pseudouridine55 synthase
MLAAAMGRPRYRKSALQGLLVVDKPVGWTSMDVVRRVRKAAGFVKTGHAGSLDPLATGVVVCCVGGATRYVETIMGLRKVYEARIDLGAFTATDDREGERREVEVPTPPTRAEVEAALARFEGEVEQVPPAFSAVHVEGERAYALARGGQAPALKARSVRVDRIEILAYEWPNLVVRVECGRGFYVRSLARDVGLALGTGGHLADLRRTAVGPYDLTRAVDAARLEHPITALDLLDPPGLTPG